MTENSSEPRLVTLGRSDLRVFPVVLSGNVFGWTADGDQTFRVLDAYRDGGGNHIDTADFYCKWLAGSRGGESEEILGKWLAARNCRSEMVIATKTSEGGDGSGLDPTNLLAAADRSLRRLGVEEIDLYYLHLDDPNVSLKDVHGTAAALSSLVDSGKVRHVALSNFSAGRLSEWMSMSQSAGFHTPVAAQAQYNLLDRDIEFDLLPMAQQMDVAVLPFFALAKQFLTGKYRDKSAWRDSDGPLGYVDDRGLRVLAALDEVAASHDVDVATVALAWNRSQEGVAGPISSASNVGELAPILRAASLELSPPELERLSEAGGESD